MAVLANHKYLGTKQVPFLLLRHLVSGLCCYLDFLLSHEKGINMLPGNIISKVNFKKKKKMGRGAQLELWDMQRQTPPEPSIRVGMCLCLKRSNG